MIIGYETADHWPGAGNRSARGWSHGGPAAGRDWAIHPRQRWPGRQTVGYHRCLSRIGERAGARARRGPGHGKRGARRRRISTAVPQGGKHYLPRGGGGVFLPVCAGVRDLGLAAAGPGMAWPGPFQVPPLCRYVAAISVLERELVLAGTKAVVPGAKGKPIIRMWVWCSVLLPAAAQSHNSTEPLRLRQYSATC